MVKMEKKGRQSIKKGSQHKGSQHKGSQQKVSQQKVSHQKVSQQEVLKNKPALKNNKPVVIPPQAGIYLSSRSTSKNKPNLTNKPKQNKKIRIPEEKFRLLQKQLGYRFNDPDLLNAAITHRSMGGAHNERLEFLGDAMLNFTIAAELYRRFPKAKEGELTRLRAHLVRGETLSILARHLDLGEFLQLGIGELKSGGHERDSILADALEAIIGALYLDGGIEEAQQCIYAWFQPLLKDLVPEASLKDAKTRLQEFLQAKKLALPEYEVVAIEGDAHNPTFRIKCSVTLLKEPIVGVANSRRRAEQAAAETVLKLLKVKGK